MAHKRKSDQPITPVESGTATATIEPEPVQNNDGNPGFAERVGHRNERVAASDPFKIAGDYLAGVHLFESRRDRLMAIKFDDKPSQPVIDKVKEADYRWNSTDRIWTHPVRLESAMGTRIDAERLYQDVRQMTRLDKGIDTGPDVPF